MFKLQKTHLILQLVFCADLQRETMIFTYYIPCLFWRQMLKTEPNTPIYIGYLKHFSNTRSKGTENNGVLFDSGSFGRNFFRLSHICQKNIHFWLNVSCDSCRAKIWFQKLNPFPSSGAKLGGSYDSHNGTLHFIDCTCWCISP